MIKQLGIILLGSIITFNLWGYSEPDSTHSRSVNFDQSRPFHDSRGRIPAHRKSNMDFEIQPGYPIASGFVILGGEYLAPPYVVTLDGNQLKINHLPVELVLRKTSSNRRNALSQTRKRNEIEKHLFQDHLLFGLEGNIVKMMNPRRTMEILEVITSSEGTYNRLKRLARLDPAWINQEQWAYFLGEFQPPENLIDRFQEIRESMVDELVEPYTEASPEPTGFAGFHYVTDMAGMLLLVVAFGNLLLNHPKRKAKWSDLNPSSDAFNLVRKCVGLIVVLSAFDFACTIMASHTGGFSELNPLAARMMDTPFNLAVFKATMVLISSAIVLKLWRYHAAQTAAWWMCLICTTVVFRWVAFQSMVMELNS
ncbi:MAG TPA: hypothetical protein EYQ50_24780 [Verrucomicrobiales bacterium]|nr:hypothetical protein [Verrucomicrobiales bacterium]HIL70392.1 hypothetical protein [Verrucomicrobiota bacterium]